MLSSRRQQVKAMMKKNNMRREIKAIAKRYRKRALWMFLLGWGVAVALYFAYDPRANVDSRTLAMGIFVTWPFVCLFRESISVAVHSRVMALKSGLKGEVYVCSQLSKLGPNFQVYNQVYIPNKRSRTGHTECDFLVVGQKAIYLVEAKNNMGEIYVDGDSNEWVVRYPSGRCVTMRNAARQVEIQKKVLTGWFKKQGMRVPTIVATVVLSNPSATVINEKSIATPIFTHPATDLLTRIQAYEDKMSNMPDIDQEVINKCSLVT